MFKNQEYLRQNEFPQLLNRTWLNSASFVPHAKSVVAAMQQFINYFYDPIIGKHVDDLFEDVAKEAIQRGAYLFDCSSKNLCFVINTAHGLNIPLHGIDWEKGDNIVTSDLEFPTNYMPWKYICKRKKVNLRSAKINNNFQISEEEIIQLIDAKTKLVSLSLVQFNNGQKLDAKKIAKVAHENNALIALDAIQACGGIEVYPSKIDVDFLSAGGPKFLMAPLGIGICYISDKVIETMEPPLQGAGNYDWQRDYMNREKPYYPGAKRFQNGTVPFYCVAGLNAALALINNVGIKTISKHNLTLTQLLLEKLIDAKMTVITPHNPEKRGAIINTRIAGNKDLNKIVEKLEQKYKVTISSRFEGLRFSTHLFNIENDIQKGFDSLKSVLNEI